MKLKLTQLSFALCGSVALETSVLDEGNRYGNGRIDEGRLEYRGRVGPFPSLGKLDLTPPTLRGAPAIHDSANTDYAAFLAQIQGVTEKCSDFKAEEAGWCVTATGADQNSGVFKLMSVDIKTAEAKDKCLERCANFNDGVGVTGCEAIWDQNNRGCYVHMKPVDHGNGYPVRHACWIHCRHVCCSVFKAEEAGYCVTVTGADQNSGVFQLIEGDVKTAKAKDECLERCANYNGGVGVTGCEAIWDQCHNRGCYVHTKPVDHGNGHARHACWIAEHAGAQTLRGRTHSIQTTEKQDFFPLLKPISDASTLKEAHNIAQDACPYVHLPLGYPQCAPGLDVSEEECEKAGLCEGGVVRNPALGIEKGSWSHVPPGCSIQGGEDKAIYYNSDPYGINEGGYNPVCQGGYILDPGYFLDKYIHTMFLVMTHNSLAQPGLVFAPSQNHDLARQFREGIRGFNLDLYEDDCGEIITSHGIGMTKEISYYPFNQINGLITELKKVENHDEFILVRLQNELKTASAAEKVCAWWGDLLIKDFDLNKPLGEYIENGQRVLMLSGPGVGNSSLIDPAIGMHNTSQVIAENWYQWSDPCTAGPPLSFRRGPWNGSDTKQAYATMLNMYSGYPAGDPMRSLAANDIERSLSIIRDFVNQTYAFGHINVVMVDFYDAGYYSIMQVQNIMRNADKWDPLKCINVYGIDQCANEGNCEYEDEILNGFLEEVANNEKMRDLINAEIHTALHEQGFSHVQINKNIPNIYSERIYGVVCVTDMTAEAYLMDVIDLDKSIKFERVTHIDTSGTDWSTMTGVIAMDVDFKLYPSKVKALVTVRGHCGSLFTCELEPWFQAYVEAYANSTSIVSVELSVSVCPSGTEVTVNNVDLTMKLKIGTIIFDSFVYGCMDRGPVCGAYDFHGTCEDEVRTKVPEKLRKAELSLDLPGDLKATLNDIVRDKIEEILDGGVSCNAVKQNESFMRAGSINDN